MAALETLELTFYEMAAQNPVGSAQKWFEAQSGASQLFYTMPAPGPPRLTYLRAPAVVFIALSGASLEEVELCSVVKQDEPAIVEWFPPHLDIVNFGQQLYTALSKCTAITSLTCFGIPFMELGFRDAFRLVMPKLDTIIVDACPSPWQLACILRPLVLPSLTYV